MTIALPEIRVGNPLCHEALSVFPLFTDTSGGTPYRLCVEALADESVVVEEVSEGGSVPDLLVDNQGDERVLFIEGEELVGAKQNRIMNTSVLIAAHTKTKIPVSCVEQGRWGYRSRKFGSSGSHSPSKLRRELKATVSASVQAKMGHRSDQLAVWNEVACLNAFHKVSSSTSAMSDCFEKYQARIADFRSSLPYVDGATGMAVAVGGRVVSVDLFDKPDTCRKVWNRLLTGIVFDALEAEGDESQPKPADVERVWKRLGEMSWELADPVGEGEEYRASSEKGDHASALVFDGTLVHGSVLAV